MSFRTDSIEIFPINLSHPNVGMGYKFIEDGKTMVFLTDNELGYRHRDGRTFDIECFALTQTTELKL